MAKFTDFIPMQEELRQTKAALAEERENAITWMNAYQTVSKERDEADRRAGAAERGWEADRESLSTFRRVLDQMKEQRGYHRNETFDRVWDETCAKADRAEKAEAALAKARDALANALAAGLPEDVAQEVRAALQGEGY